MEYFPKRLVYVASKQEVENIMNDIKSFFSSFSFENFDSQFQSAPELNQQNTCEKDNITSDEQRKFENLLNSKQNIFNFLFENPERCRIIVKKEIDKIKSIYTKKNHFDFENLVFFSDSLELYDFVFFQNKPVKASVFNRDPLKKARKAMHETLKKRKFIIFPKNRIKTIDIDKSIGEIVSPTAFTANESCVFIGEKGGIVRFIPLDKSLNQLSFSIPELAEVPFSLCQAMDSIFVISETLFKIDKDTGMYYKLKSRTKPFFPTVSDGFYFYSVNKNFEVFMFSFVENQFILLKTLQLKKPDDFPALSQLSFTTDGTIITFILNEGEETLFYGFSLVTRHMLWKEKYVSNNGKVITFTLLPFVHKTIALLSNHFEIFYNETDEPRWIIGFPLPNFSKKVSIIEMFSILLYHGIDTFTECNTKTAINIFKKFSENKDTAGIYTIINIMRRENYMHLFDSFSKRTNTMETKTYVTFSFLVTLRISSGLHYKEHENIVSNYIVNGGDFHLILLFYELFDFKRLYLSRKAISKFISEASKYWNNYKIQIEFMIKSFLVNFVYERIRRGKINDSIEPLQEIAAKIQLEVTKHFATNQKIDFTTTAAYSIWKHLLHVIFELRSEWMRFGSVLTDCLSITAEFTEKEAPENIELIKMINRTQFLHIVAVFSLTKHKKELIPCFNDFLNEYKHPLNRADLDLDKMLYQTLKRTSDIVTMDSFAHKFQEIRNTIIIENIDKSGLVSLSSRFSNFDSSSIIPYLQTKNQNQLIFVTSINSTFKRFVNKCSSFQCTQKKNDFIIMAQFKDQIKEYEEEFLNCEAEKLNKLLKWSFFPFIFPGKLVEKACYNIQEIVFNNTPIEYFEIFLENTIEGCKYITNKKQFFLSVAPMFKNFEGNNFNLGPFQNIYVQLYRHVVILNIAVKAGLKLEFASYVQYFKAILHNADYKIIHVFLQALFFKADVNQLLGFLEHLMNTVGIFITEGKALFSRANSNLENIVILFEIIRMLRSLWNKSRDFSIFIFDCYLKSNTRMTRAAVYAILNDSFDYLRKGSNISFLDKSNIFIEGEIENINFKEKTIDVNGTSYNYNTITNIIPKVDDVPKLSMVHRESCYQQMADLFQNHEEEDNKQLQAFRNASLAFFAKHETFCRCLSNEFIEKMIKETDSSQFFEGDAFNEFIYSLSRESECLPFFSFLCCPLQATGKHEKPRRKTGMLTSGKQSITYVSTSLHPRTESTIKLSTFSLTKDKTIGEVSVFALLRTTGEKFRSEVIPFNVSFGTKTEITITIAPNEHAFFVKTNEETTKHLIPYAAKILFIDVDLNPMKSINYVFESSGKYVEATENTKQAMFMKDEGKQMIVSHLESILPFSDSSFYIKCLINETAAILSKSFNFAALCELLKNMKIKSHASFVLDSLSYVNPFPLEEKLNFDEITKKLFVGNVQDTLLEFAKQQVEMLEINEFYEEFSRRINNKNNFFIKPNNTNCFVLAPHVKTELKDSIIISPASEKPFKMTEINKAFCLFNHESLVIPCSAPNGTIIDLLLNIRYILSIAIIKEEQEVSRLLSIIEEATRNYSFANVFFASSIELINAIFPAMPEKGMMNSFSLATFLFKESRIFNHPDEALLSIIECTTNQFQIGERPMTLNFVSSPTLFIGTRDNSGIVTEMSFIINTKGETKIVKPGEYLIIECDTLTISKSINDDSIVDIFVAPITNEYKKVIYELKEWTFSDSHELRAAFESVASLEYSDYSMIPMSSKFSFLTAKTVCAILEKLQSQRNKSKLRTPELHCPECVIENLQRYSPESRINVLEPQKLSIEKCRRIADASKDTVDRISYIKSKLMNTLFVGDASFIRYEATPALDIESLRENPRSLFKYIQNDEDERWKYLFSYISYAPAITILEFCEAVTGTWPMTNEDLKNQSIVCFSSNEEKLIDAFKEQRMIIIGSFNIDVDLFESMNKFIYDRKLL